MRSLRIASEGAPRRKSVVEARFICKICKEEAGLVQLLGKPPASWIHRESFVSNMDSVIADEQFEPIRAALDKRDIRVLHGINRYVASFFCSTCDACYCGKHW